MLAVLFRCAATVCPFSSLEPDGVAGPRMDRLFDRHLSPGRARGWSGGCPAGCSRNRAIIESGPSSRHSPVGLFQLTCYLVPQRPRFARSRQLRRRLVVLVPTHQRCSAALPRLRRRSHATASTHSKDLARLRAGRRWSQLVAAWAAALTFWGSGMEQTAAGLGWMEPCADPRGSTVGRSRLGHGGNRWLIPPSRA